jgi:hypothetical protein
MEENDYGELNIGCVLCCVVFLCACVRECAAFARAHSFGISTQVVRRERKGES